MIFYWDSFDCQVQCEEIYDEQPDQSQQTSDEQKAEVSQDEL